MNIDTKIICSGWYVFNGSLSCQRGEDGIACVACAQAIQLWRAKRVAKPASRTRVSFHGISRDLPKSGELALRL